MTDREWKNAEDAPITKYGDVAPVQERATRGLPEIQSFRQEQSTAELELRRTVDSKFRIKRRT